MERGKGMDHKKRKAVHAGNNANYNGERERRARHGAGKASKACQKEEEILYKTDEYAE